MSYIIYKHTLVFECEHKGWSYIGQTVQSPNRRWRNNGDAYKDQLFGKAIKKYGWNNFQHTILVNNIKTIEEANKLEEYYIKYYHTSIYDKNCMGYNVSPGGNNRENYGKAVLQLDSNKHIINEFNTISAAARFVNRSPDRISKCCNHPELCKTAAGYFWCFKKDFELFQPDKLQKVAIYKLDSYKNILATYDSISSAGLALGKPKNNNISTCINNNTNFAYGYYWCKVEDYDKLVINFDQHIKQIYCIDNDMIFNSLTQAANFAQVSISAISNCCKYKTKHAGGYKWAFLKDFKNQIL